MRQNTIFVVLNPIVRILGIKTTFNVGKMHHFSVVIQVSVLYTSRKF